MKAIDLYKYLKSRIEDEPKSKDFEDLEVVVVTNDPSMGPRACTGLKFINKGFDWETGRLNLITEDKIILKK